MTCYEFAAAIYRAILRGADRYAAFGSDERLQRLLKEFKAELAYIQLDTIQTDKYWKTSSSACSHDQCQIIYRLRFLHTLQL